MRYPFVLGALFVLFAALLSPSATTAPRPVVVVFMENHEYPQITASNAPYLTSVAGTRLSNYYGNEHPSLPNYLAFASGSDQGKQGSDGVSAGQFHATTLWDQLGAAGVSWGVYAEGMGTTCLGSLTRIYTDAQGKNKYVLRHNPATPFASVYGSASCQNVRDLSAMPAVLPAVSFVVPAICNDMHGQSNAPTYPANCASGTQAVIARGDAWLAAHVPTWLAAGAEVVITFDEGTTGSLAVPYHGGHVYAVVAGAGSGIDATRFDHWSVLAALEDRYGLARLGGASGVSAVPL